MLVATAGRSPEPGQLLVEDGKHGPALRLGYFLRPAVPCPMAAKNELKARQLGR